MRLKFVVTNLERLPAGYRATLNCQEALRTDLVLHGPSHFLLGDLSVSPLRQEVAAQFEVGREFTVTLEPGAVPEIDDRMQWQKGGPRNEALRRAMATGELPAGRVMDGSPQGPMTR